MGLTKDLGSIPRAITVDSSNNVGVGTSPAQKFQINGALALSNLAEDFTTNQQFAYPIIYSSNLSGLGNGELVIQPRTTATRSIRFVTRGAGAVSSTNPDTRMMIKWDGNIGIGTTNPLTISNYRIVTTNDVSGSGYAAQTNGVLSLYSYSNANGSTISEQRSLPLFFETNGTERIRIFSGGNVFIGPSASDNGARLQVSGNTYSEGLHIATGQFVIGGGNTATFYTFSNISSNRVFMVTVRQSGSGANNVVGMAFTFGGGGGAYNIGQDNTNSALFLTISMSGLGLRLTTASGYGSTTWDWTVTQIK
jgi:hypothetical protein